jgi:hypothetical protein
MLRLQSRRKFFKAAAVTGAAAVATVAMPNVGAFSAAHGKNGDVENASRLACRKKYLF